MLHSKIILVHLGTLYVKLAIAKKREWMARVEREWAEEEVAKLSAR